MRLPVLWLSFFFRWYDLWIGVYVDTVNHNIYICPLPMIGMKIHWRMEQI